MANVPVSTVEVWAVQSLMTVVQLPLFAASRYNRRPSSEVVWKVYVSEKAGINWPVQRTEKLVGADGGEVGRERSTGGLALPVEIDADVGAGEGGRDR